MMDKMREEFEAWAKTSSLKNFLFWHQSDDQYEVHAVQMAFDGWKASRAALCVELPPQWFSRENDDEIMSAGNVIEALGEAGVPFK